MADDTTVGNRTGQAADYIAAGEELGAAPGAKVQSIELYTVAGAAGSKAKTKFGTETNPIRMDPTGDTPQPITADELPLPEGAATAAGITALGVLLAAIEAAVEGTLTVSGPLTDAQLRAAAVAVSLAHPALTPAAPAQASVSNSSGEAVALNASRKGMTLVNTSDAWIYIAFAAHAAVVGRGTPIAPGGGSWTMTKETFTTAAVNAIASAAGGKNLAIQEYN